MVGTAQCACLPVQHKGGLGELAVRATLHRPRCAYTWKWGRWRSPSSKSTSCPKQAFERVPCRWFLFRCYRKAMNASASAGSRKG